MLKQAHQAAVNFEMANPILLDQQKLLFNSMTKKVIFIKFHATQFLKISKKKVSLMYYTVQIVLMKNGPMIIKNTLSKTILILYQQQMLMEFHYRFFFG